MASGFRNEGEMRSAQHKPLIDTRFISNYKKPGHNWVTITALIITAVLWTLLIIVESSHV
jgi:hypothetical protein